MSPVKKASSVAKKKQEDTSVDIKNSSETVVKKRKYTRKAKEETVKNYILDIPVANQINNDIKIENKENHFVDNFESNFNENTSNETQGIEKPVKKKITSVVHRGSRINTKSEVIPLEQRNDNDFNQNQEDNFSRTNERHSYQDRRRSSQYNPTRDTRGETRFQRRPYQGNQNNYFNNDNQGQQNQRFQSSKQQPFQSSYNPYLSRKRPPYNKYQQQGGQKYDSYNEYDRENQIDSDEKLKDDLKNSYEAKGVLDVTSGGYGFLRKNYIINPESDIYVSSSQIRRFSLRKGDEVEGFARPSKTGERFHSLLIIKKINDIEMNEELSRNRVSFESLTSLHPQKQIILETEKDVLSTRIVDLISPIGFGQRALIVSQPKAGKTTFLKEIATGIGKNHPDAYVMAILIGERPEEVTELRRFIKGEVASSNFDDSPKQQVKVASLALERAKRLVETGRDVVILLDSITRLARAFNFSVENSGRSLSGGFDPQALFPAKKFLGAARNCEEGGSLTIIGTALVGTESRMDDLIYEEFKGTGNMEVHLERKFAEKRIYPAINIERSGTRHEEILLSEENMKLITILRRMLFLMDPEERLVKLIEQLTKTESNKIFLDTLRSKL